MTKASYKQSLEIFFGSLKNLWIQKFHWQIIWFYHRNKKVSLPNRVKLWQKKKNDVENKFWKEFKQKGTMRFFVISFRHLYINEAFWFIIFNKKICCPTIQNQKWQKDIMGILTLSCLIIVMIFAELKATFFPFDFPPSIVRFLIHSFISLLNFSSSFAFSLLSNLSHSLSLSLYFSPFLSLSLSLSLSFLLFYSLSLFFSFSLFFSLSLSHSYSLSLFLSLFLSLSFSLFLSLSFFSSLSIFVHFLFLFPWNYLSSLSLFFNPSFYLSFRCYFIFFLFLSSSIYLSVI